MRSAKCDGCGRLFRQARMARIRDRILCVQCVHKTLRGPDGVRPGEIQKLVDPTLCTGCAKDNGEEAFPRLAGLPMCGACATRMRRQSLPWPIGVIAGVTALVVVAGVFWLGELGPAAAQTREAEKLVAERRYISAAKEFGRTLDRYPFATRTRLLRIEALLLADRLDEARREMEQTRVPSGSLGRRVRVTAERIEDAIREFNIAMQAYRKGDLTIASDRIYKAHEQFPESRRVRARFLLIRGLYAFDRDDMEYYIKAHDLLGQQERKDFEAVLFRSLAVAARHMRTQAGEDRRLAESLFKQARELAAAGHAKTVEEADQELRMRLDEGKLSRFPRGR